MNDKGLALLLTMALILVSLGATTVLIHRIQSLMLVTQNEDYLDKNAAPLSLGMGKALTLLETGTPAVVPTNCRMPLGPDAANASVVVEFSRVGPQWKVSVSSDTGDTMDVCPGKWTG